MLLHLNRRAFGDFPAKIQYHHLVRDLHDEMQMMLNQHDSQMATITDLSNEHPQRFHFLVVQPSGWLIQQEEGGIARQCTGQLYTFQGSKGQTSNRVMGDRCQIEPSEKVQSGRGDTVLFVTHPWQSQGMTEKTTPRLAMHTYHDILQNRHRLEQGEILECAPNPERRDMIGSQRQERTIFEEDLSPGWSIQPTETVEEGRFARAVRADEANNMNDPPTG